jgi:MFS family permease
MVASGNPIAQSGSTFAPLKEPNFRRIWSASLLSNFGQLILGVGAAWEMTRLTSSPSMIALVQTALMLPLMLVAVPAGAIADMFDRRKIAMAGLAFAIISSMTLTTLAFLGLTTPWILLGFCSLVGVGVALYSPSWQASISEQVKPANLPAAIALGSISYNVARSVGPALGGVIVKTVGAQIAFAINAACYLPLLLAFYLWQRKQVPSRLPPERIDRAIVSGTRYAMHSPPIRRVLGRAFVITLCGATAAALAPLIAKTLLNGDASIYGLLLGAGGIGAVFGSFFIQRIRDRFHAETAVRVLSVIGGISLIGLGQSHWLWLSCLLFGFASATAIMTISLLNVSVQTSVPRWVTARALSLYQSALTGGVGIGAWLWGSVAATWGIEAAMAGSGVALMLTPLFGLLMPLPDATDTDFKLVELDNEVEVGLALTMRSGPVAIEVDYTVDPDRARDFYDAMLKVQRTRLRNGGFGWSLSRDIADPRLWTERFSCPTWGDYLRMRDRYTQADLDAHAAGDAFNLSEVGRVVRRRLERPFGSVRWRADSLDPRQKDIAFIVP